jgi:hypothetical protein
MFVCVYTYTRVRVYTHTCVHSVYMWRDMRMQMHVLVYTHIQARIHVYACAPCPPRHDPPLTPSMRQHGAMRTPLWASIFNGHTDTVRALLQAGATVDAKDKVRGALLSECMCVCFRIRV